MPICALAVLSMSLAWAVYQQGGVLTRDWDVSLLAIGLLAVVWCFFRLKRPTPPLSRASQALILVFILIVALQIVPLPLAALRVLSPVRASLAAAIAPVVGPVRFATLTVAPARTAEHILRLAGYLLVFLIVRDLAWHWRSSAWLPALPLIAIAACEAAFGLVRMYAQSLPMATGTYVNHNHFAGFLEMCLPFSVLYPISLTARPRAVWKVLASVAAALLIAAAILCSQSRMGAVSSFLALLTTGIIAARRAARTRWVVLALIVGTILAMVALVPSGLLARFAGPVFDFDLGWRTSVWRDASHLIADYPLFGCGLGAFESCFTRYQTVTPMFAVDFAHNDYVQGMAELGLIAFATGLIFLFTLLVRGALTAINHPSRDRRLIALACVGALVAILVHSAADFNLYLPANAMLLAWIAGIAATPAI
jgi:O-antigen ligase